MKVINQYKGLRKELYILFIGRMMTALGQMIQPMLTLILSQKLGLNAATIALVFLVYTFVSIPLNILGGKLADRLNKRNIIIVCDLISVSSYIYCFFMDISITSMVIFGIASLFQSIEGPAYDALIADFSKSKDRDRAYSLGYLGMNLGLVLAPTLGGILFKNYLNLAFLINGLLILFSTILIFALIKDVHKEEDEDLSYEKELDDKTSALKIISGNRVLLLYLIMAVFESGFYNMYNYLMPLDLGIMFEETGSIIYGTMSSLNCIEVALLTAFITNIVAKRSDMGKSVIGQIFEITGILIFVLGMKNIYMDYIAIFIFTLGEILCTIASSPFLTRRIPASHRGRIISTVYVSSQVGSALLENATGKIHDVKGMMVAWCFVLILGFVALILKGTIRVIDKKDYSKLYKGTN